MFKLFVSYALDRLREPSTWNGFIVAGAGAYHLAVSQTTAGAVASAGAALAGAVAVVMKERDGK